MKEKSFGVDILRIVSMICVVLLHTVSNGLRTDIGSDTWNTINLLSSFATCAVPVFFMISGYLILSSENTLSVSYTITNRIPRLVIPLFLWSVIYIILQANMYHINRGAVLDLVSIWDSIFTIWQKECAVHFWFMYYLIPLYLIAPFIKKACDESKDRVIVYILILWGITLLLNTVSKFADDQYKNMFSIAFINNIDFVGGYGGYFLLGWYIGKKEFKFGILVRIVAIAIGIYTVHLIASGTEYYTMQAGEYDEWIKSYKSIAVCVLSICVFVLFKDIRIRYSLPKHIIQWLSSVCYGVYLCHNIILYMIAELDLGKNTGDEMFRNFWYVLAISIGLITILTHIKFINFIFTGMNKNDYVSHKLL